MEADPYRYFRIEAAEIVEELGKGVLALEKGAQPNGLTPQLLRLTHTLKGAARVVKHATLAELAHAAEDLLAPLRERSSPIERERADAAMALLDAMSREVAALNAAPTSQVASVAARATGDEEILAVRTDLAEMDALIECIARAEVGLRGLEAVAEILARARRLAEQVATETAALPHRGVLATLDGLRAALNAVGRALEDAGNRTSSELRLAREGAEQLRLRPCSVMFASLERAARDAAHATGKRVTFAAKGGHVRLDAHVLAVVHAALVQIVRNAVAHGIETERERVTAGKPRSGALELAVLRRGRRVLFVCRDDGRGVDLEGVRRVVRERGLVTSDAQQLDQEELLRLLMKGGITTSQSVTELTGRGVGLDVVREAAARLGGSVEVHTNAGHGTTFEISVPASVASVDALVVEVSGLHAVVPIDAVRGSLRVEARDVAQTEDGQTILHEDLAVPFVPLARLLGLPVAPKVRSPGPAPGEVALVVEAAGSRAAVAVDRVIGAQSVLLRALPSFIQAAPIVAAASLDVAGDPRLVLDPDALVLAARSAKCSARREVSAARPPLLVIDDSLTTRMLEQSILESAGYTVDVASSAHDGLEKARSRRYGVYLVDVEMPGMDGFTFVEQTRADPRLRRTPAILVTSRGSLEDRQRGANVGAAAYIVKGDFDQTELLRTIQSLLGDA